MNKKMKLGIGFLLVIIMLFSVCGCALARDGAEIKPKDQLIGGFVTRYPINGRIEAAVDWWDQSEIYDLYFEGHEGMIVYTSEEDHEGNSFIRNYGNTSSRNSNIREDEDGYYIEITATLYFVPRGNGEVNEFYLNPIYLTEDREIYARPGHSISADVSMSGEGTKLTLSYYEEESRTLADERIINRTDIKVELYAAYEPTKITLYQMSKDHQVIKEETHIPNEGMNDFARMEPETAYVHIVTEKLLSNGKTIKVREAVAWQGDMMEDFEGDDLVERKYTSYENYYCVEDGFLRKDHRLFIWADKLEN